MSTQRASGTTPTFAAEARGLGIAWLALLALMLLSLGSSYLRLGTGNLVAGLVIASLKAAIVAWWFMHLKSGSATLRATALVALCMLALLWGLSGVDLWTRRADPAAVQVPRQIEPVLQQEGSAGQRR